MNLSNATYTEIDIFNFTKKAMPFITFPSIILVAYFSKQPIWTLVLAISIPFIGFLTGEIFLRYKVSVKEITLPLQFILVFSLFIVSGPGAPAWLLSISGLAIIMIQKIQPRIKVIAAIAILIGTAFGNYFSGVDTKTNLIAIFVLANISIFLFRLLQFLNKINQQLQQERKKADQLLLNILPFTIAEELKEQKGSIYKKYSETSILFADIVNFTKLSEQLSAKKLVETLNQLFSEFDDLTDKFGLEKIKTIGDAYMVAAGVPDEKKEHAKFIFNFAKEMLQTLENFNLKNNTNLKLRIGISSGPVVAGVIGKKKFAYDLWGDTVNTAARMEANGQASRIQVSPTTYEILKSNFDFERVPDIDIKGKGKMDVYLWKS